MSLSYFASFFRSYNRRRRFWWYSAFRYFDIDDIFNRDNEDELEDAFDYDVDGLNLDYILDDRDRSPYDPDAYLAYLHTSDDEEDQEREENSDDSSIIVLDEFHSSKLHSENQFSNISIFLDTFIGVNLTN